MVEKQTLEKPVTEVEEEVTTAVKTDEEKTAEENLPEPTVEDLKAKLEEETKKREEAEGKATSLESTVQKLEQDGRAREISKLRVADLNRTTQATQNMVQILLDAQTNDTPAAEVTKKIEAAQEEASKGRTEDLETLTKPVGQKIWQIGQEAGVDPNTSPEFEVARLYFGQALAEAQKPNGNVEHYLAKAETEAMQAKVKIAGVKPPTETPTETPPPQKKNLNQDLGRGGPSGGKPKTAADAARLYNEGKITSSEYSSYRTTLPSR